MREGTSPRAWTRRLSFDQAGHHQRGRKQDRHHPKTKAEMAVETVFESMKKALEQGDRIELRGFGVFNVKPRKTGIGRNPRTGAEVSIPPGKAVRFKPARSYRRCSRPLQAAVHRVISGFSSCLVPLYAEEGSGQADAAPEASTRPRYWLHVLAVCADACHQHRGRRGHAARFRR